MLKPSCHEFALPAIADGTKQESQKADPSSIAVIATPVLAITSLGPSALGQIGDLRALANELGSMFTLTVKGHVEKLLA